MYLRRFFATVALLPVLGFGQSHLGTILGHVTDPESAVVPGARVTLRNEATNISVAKTSNATGDYVFANVEPGKYEIDVQAGGFSPYLIKDVTLDVGETVRRDVTLAVGTVSSAVSVVSQQSLVQTDTSYVGSVVESTQIKQMPLNGRTNIFGLLALAPGVQSTGANAKIAGSSWRGGYNETLDGVNNMEMENARLSGSDPSLESIGEFQLVDSTGSAEFGPGTVQLILSSKQGTNQFHGSLFAYNRNAALAAKNFFATGLAKPPYNRNEFGGSLGGPIKRDKLFFFGSFEGLEYRSSSTSQTAQPTAALKNGDFSGLGAVIDPATQEPFPDNQIPTSQINPISEKLLPYFETPNIATSVAGGLGTNYIANLPNSEHNFRYQGRVDYSITSKDSVYARYYYLNDTNEPSGPTPLFGGQHRPFNSQSLAVNYTRVISPTTTNVLTFGFERETDLYQAQNSDFDVSSLFPGFPAPHPGLGGLPTVSITGFSGIAENVGSGDTIPTYQMSNILTHIAGKHTIKAGFSYLRYQFDNFQTPSPSHGAFSFTGQYTGNAFADFLLGDLAGSTEPLGALEASPTNDRFGFFIQDDWRVTPKLTINMGLRYDLPTLYVNTKGGMSNYYPNLGQLVVLKGTYDTTAYPDLPIVSGSSVGMNTGNYMENDLNQLAPRLGIAWRPFDSSKLVVRAGYGIYYNTMPWAFGSFEIGTNPPFSGTRSFEPAAGSTPTLFFDNPFPTGTGTTPSGIGIIALPYSYQYPETHQWNLTLESQVASNLAFRATYLGAEREHSGFINPINTPLPAPGPVQPRRPNQDFGDIQYWENGATASTQMLQLSAIRRFNSGLSFEVEYALTKELDSSLYDQSEPTDPQNLRLDRGNDPMIRRHYLVANYVYDLPFGAGRRYLSNLHGPLNLLIGGWEASGIITLASGLPYSVVFSSSVEGWPSSRADIVGDASVSHPSIQQWFNPAAFATPAPFAYGNSAPNSLFGPGFSNWDAAFMKNFQITEQLHLQFRSDLFNILNHPSFSNPQSNISVPSTVGTITSTSNSPRVVQFALRLEF